MMSLHDLYITYFLLELTTVDPYPLKSLGPGRLLATFLCLSLLSLRPPMFESVSSLIVSVSLVGMLFLVFILIDFFLGGEGVLVFVTSLGLIASN